jgi:hypothetical protein
MWVDDKWPGYAESLNKWARTSHDRNPNRTRDHLRILKYSLRSIARYAPWRGKIYIVTCRPQLPTWLNCRHPDIRVVHHDEFMPPELLPTFNSFAIQSWLHALPGLSQRFVCFDDDSLLMQATTPSDFMTADGRPLYHFEGHLREEGGSNERVSPWTASCANCSKLLDEVHPGPHAGFSHGAKLFDKNDCADLIGHFPEAFRRTWQSRFRAHHNAPLDALMPPYLVALGRAEAASKMQTRRQLAYLGLENFAPWNRYKLWSIRRRGVTFLTLNDNFGARPTAGALAVAEKFLEREFPEPSPFEIASA